MRNRTRTVLVGTATAALLLAVAPAGATAARGAAGGAPGTIDSTFGTNGKVLAPFGVPTAAVRQADGAIVVAGPFGVARFLAGGAVDTGFGSGGAAATGFADLGLAPSGVAVQPDGKIVWVGNQTVYDGHGGTVTDFAVARFTATGALDPAFGTGGRVTTEFFAPPLAGAQEFATSVLVQPDGRILVGGSARQGQSRTAPILGALARFTPNGALDTGFGTGGQVLSGPMGNADTLGLDAAGDIFVLPTHTELSPAGRVAATVTPAPITASSARGDAAFRPDGGYVVAQAVGVSRHVVDVQVRRYGADGSPLSTSAPFAYTGTTGATSESAGAVAVQPDGRAVVGGAHFLSTSVFGLARVNTDGTLDAGFGTGGVLTTDVQGDDTVTALIVQPDGKIVAVGMSEDNATGEVDVALVRYNG